MAEVYGIFEGGRVRGIALVGAVAAAEERQITFRATAGSSAGAIVASLLAADDSAGEMRRLLTEMNFKDFKDPITRILGLQKIVSWWKLGLLTLTFDVI